MALDVLAERLPSSAWQKKFKGLFAKAEMNKDTILLFKPMTFMNLSGEAVNEALQYFKITIDNVIVFHDDIDLFAGQIKVKQGGGAGGHNGLRSLDSHIGKDYWRVRLGVGRPEHKGEVTNFVLGNFAKADKDWLEPLLGKIPEALPSLFEGNSALFIQKLLQKDAL